MVKRLPVWLALGSVAIGSLVALMSDRTPSVDPEGAAPGTRTIGDPAPGFLRSPLHREGFGKPRGDIFGGVRGPDAKGEKPVVSPAPGIVAPPAPPPMPYRMAGTVAGAEGTQAVLAKGDAVLVVRRGDIVDGDWRVDAVGPDGVTLAYLPLGMSRALVMERGLPPNLARAAAAPRSPAARPAGQVAPATLRWDGPAQVRAGQSFTVALKVTAAQALRASPLRMSFDAGVLEPVGVKAGPFYADGIFSYQVNPAGSIFVGAAGKASSIPSDAGLVLVTFKPVRAGATAELKLSSLVLQGAGGAIAHERPAVYRASVLQ